MRKQDKITGPWYNPLLDEGIYDAVIDELRHTSFGENDDPMVQILLRIPSKRTYLITNVYFPHGRSIGSQQRLWYLSTCVGLTLAELYEYPEDFAGRQLRVHLQPQSDGLHETYSDVTAFLPSVESGEQYASQEIVYRTNHVDWIRPLGEPA